MSGAVSGTNIVVFILEFASIEWPLGNTEYYRFIYRNI